ncbi:DUF4351 domain-containing protein [Pigmentiphaga soli]|uniref:DUF4351 domain-containing protein n=1 Tax=Pigmentiphaga soli TaxID=1007095 RepID=UPI0031EEDC8C
MADEIAALRYATEEGLKRGRQEGQARQLERLLTHKFGPLPAALLQRLQTASLQDLDAWALKVLDATSLEAVFDHQQKMGGAQSREPHRLRPDDAQALPSGSGDPITAPSNWSMNSGPRVRVPGFSRATPPLSPKAISS